MKRGFAFGSPIVGETRNPPMRSDGSTRRGFVNIYDVLLFAETNELDGVVGEPLARKAWMLALDTALKIDYSSELKPLCFRVLEHLRVAVNLGWATEVKA